ncbi:thiol-disulfide oxidoreductase DCC family protein [Arvimicrobium flavum]|uniref:thiol-disulfide oxidoreductase DCC family protein n=1 Tax=Arvimicrobium flavum TaxID=3393320 RepID=UPI00237B60A4|nr:DUF393 domain-containing protein [Mesorhizobium shangrilense]
MNTSNTETKPQLADILPAALGDRHLVVFDGVCVLCSGFARTIMRLDRHDRFRFTTAQSPLGEALFRRFGLPVDDYETNLVLVDGVAHLRMEGFIAANGRAGLAMARRTAASPAAGRPARPYIRPDRPQPASPLWPAGELRDPVEGTAQAPDLMRA